MLQFSCGDFEIVSFVGEAKPVDWLISRGAEGLNCFPRGTVFFWHIVIRCRVNTLDLSSFNNLVRGLFYRRGGFYIGGIGYPY